MKIKTWEVQGFRPAMHGMRNPMDSWEKSDSKFLYKVVNGDLSYKDYIGEADRDLSVRLQKAGPEHCKHLRMIMVWADITAPRYWWNEFDTYRNGVEKVSCSTMHKLMARELTAEDFADCNDGCYGQMLLDTKDYINRMIDRYKKETDPTVKRSLWEYVIQVLPQSYLQKRTVMMSYAALRNIYRQREGHKLQEWHQFREWVEGLPCSWMITE